MTRNTCGFWGALMLLVSGVVARGAETNHDFAKWEKEIAAFERMDQTNPPPKDGILFIGSSTIRLWKTLAQDYPDQPVVNRGFGGSEIVDATHYADRIVFPYQPRMILLRSGGNDLWRGRSPEQVFADFEEFVATVHTRLPQTEIVFISVNATPSRWVQREQIKRLNAFVEAYVRRQPHLRYIETYPLALEDNGQPRRELFVSDGLHFSAAGYALLAERIRPFLPPATGSPSWQQTATLPAEEAAQAAATDDAFVYAITNDRIAKYDRATGRRMALSTGDAHHLNSGFFWQGRLYCAHSNYPQKPERSEIKVLDTETMQLTTLKEFGEFGGSLTWAIRDSAFWWCHFARYGKENASSFLVKFDLEWKELGRWLDPPELLASLNGSSLSGGVWHKGGLLATDHDNRFVYQLGIPSEGKALLFVRKQSSPFPGQGIAADQKTGGLVGIDRKAKMVVFANESASAGSRVFHVDTVRGDDARDGLKPETAWRSLARVNRATLSAGDRVLFRRGQTWRGQLVPRSGTARGAVCYGDYGEGPKPMLLGSLAADRPEDWQPVAPGIWASVQTNRDLPLSVDVGNIIFDHGQSTGTKKWTEADLHQEGDYFFDPRSSQVKLRSAANPATRHQSIELALRQHIINQGGRSYVAYENLDLRYGAAHGIGGGSTHHITIRGCDISFIGGGHQFTHPDGKPVRFGNGIEFWSDARDCLVEDCRLWEIYDAALTNQGDGTNVQENITYRRNVIWNSEYSFEYWNRGPASRTCNIVFEHNTCVDAGRGWGHSQRPDPNGRHLMFYDNTASTTNVVIRNNIFCNATDSLLRLHGRDWTSTLIMNGNCWFQPHDTVLLWGQQSIGADAFVTFMHSRGLDLHSVLADPKFVDPAQRDYRLLPDSPARTPSAPGRFAGALPPI